MSVRLRMALETGGLSWPDAGTVSILHPRSEMDLTGLPKDRVQIVQPMKPDHDHFEALGFDCVAESDADAAAVLVCLPRAKALARALVAKACERCSGTIVVDGAKTDGIDSLLKACRALVEVSGPVAKAHGKTFWFASDPVAFRDWAAPEDVDIGGYVTAPGVFSADGIDPASRVLAAALPDLSGRVVDLGAGWGYLSAKLSDMLGIKSIDLVEADFAALTCARQNIPDPRARFHWADATIWTAEAGADVVVMNPPFHTGRAADPSLGRAFIRSAARLLTPSGHLWMVANRHLPYEACLAEAFSVVEEAAGDARFKVLHAQRPTSARRPRLAGSKPVRTRS